MNYQAHQYRAQQPCDNASRCCNCAIQAINDNPLTRSPDASTPTVRFTNEGSKRQPYCPHRRAMVLEVEPDLRRQCTRRDVVRAAEGGKKVVKSVLVCDVDGRELETHLVLIAPEQVVMSDGNIEQASRRDTRWVLVVVLRVRL